MMVNKHLVIKYVLAVALSYVCGTATVLMGFSIFTFSEVCVNYEIVREGWVDYEVVCEEWVVPVSILGIISFVVATVSGWGLFRLFR